MEENNENLVKEMQQSYNKILDSLHTMSINVYKSNEQKLEDFKQSTLTSMQSLGYNLNIIHQDVKEIKDESHYVKNRVKFYLNLILFQLFYKKTPFLIHYFFYNEIKINVLIYVLIKNIF